MNKDIIILIAEDDDGHAALLQRNLKRSGILNKMVRFKNGTEVLDFFDNKGELRFDENLAYLLLLDIRMPGRDGIEVLKYIKADQQLRKIPVIMVTTTDDPNEISKCHDLGCNSYVIKPVDYEKFIKAIQQLGLFLRVVQVPVVNGEYKE